MANPNGSDCEEHLYDLIDNSRVQLDGSEQADDKAELSFQRFILFHKKQEKLRIPYKGDIHIVRIVFYSMGYLHITCLAITWDQPNNMRDRMRAAAQIG